MKKNPKFVERCRREYICVVCEKVIVKGSSYVSKPYISPVVTDFFLENGLGHWSLYLNMVYINLPCCSEECFVKLSHKDNVHTMFAKNVEPIINTKLEVLREMKKRGLIER